MLISSSHICVLKERMASTDVSISATVVTSTAVRQRPGSGSTVRVPSVDIRPTTVNEMRALPDHAMRSDLKARMMWSQFPEMNAQETLQVMQEARTVSRATDLINDDAWRPSSPAQSRCDSASSVRTPATLSRPGSGPTRTSAQNNRSTTASHASLLAADTQHIMSLSMGLEDVLPTRPLYGEAHDVRPQSSFVLSLRFATNSQDDQRPGSSVRPVQGVHHRRAITRAPISLLKKFEERVRCSTPYAPCGPRSAPDNQHHSVSSLAPAPTSSVNGTNHGHVAPRAQCNAQQPNKPFHTRGDYTADVVDGVLNELEYFSFRAQDVRDIHEKGLMLKKDVEHCRLERTMMAELRHDTMKSEIAFWQNNRPPTVVDLEHMLPGKGNSTREVNVFVGKLLEQTRHAVEHKINRAGATRRSISTSTLGHQPPPIKWSSSRERSDYYAFVGKAPPPLHVAQPVSTKNDAKKRSSTASYL